MQRICGEFFKLDRCILETQLIKRFSVKQRTPTPRLFSKTSSLCSSSSNSRRKFIPRRALLYVPGSDKKKITKSAALGADCVVLDCEDGVASNRKKEARESIKDVLNENIDFNKSELAVRVNSLGSGLLENDLHVISLADNLPQALVLPKVDTVSELKKFSEICKAVFSKHGPGCQMNLITQVESALGLLNLSDILKEGKKLSEVGLLYLDAVIFGSDDFCASICATRTEDAKELMYARQKTVAVTRAFGVQAIDLVHINFKDLESLSIQSLEGSRMGFSGKQVIHPAQVPVVQKAFSPSDDMIQYAQELIAAFKDHESTGKGAFVFNDKMIDMPSVLQAKNIIRLSDNVN